jgi:competence transcription factor ComK
MSADNRLKPTHIQKSWECVWNVHTHISHTKKTTNEGKTKMNKDTNETVMITVRTAWVAMEMLNDMLDWVEFLDDETRRQIIALDELVRVLDAESVITDKRDKIIAERQREWAERQATEKAKTKAVK